MNKIVLVLLFLLVTNCQMARAEYRNLTMTDDEKLAEANQRLTEQREKENIESEEIKNRQRKLEEAKYPYEEEEIDYVVKCQNQLGKIVVWHAGIYDIKSINLDDPYRRFTKPADAHNYLSHSLTILDKRTGDVSVKYIDNVRCIYDHYRTSLWLHDKEHPNGIFKKFIWTNPEFKGKQFKELE